MENSKMGKQEKEKTAVEIYAIADTKLTIDFLEGRINATELLFRKKDALIKAKEMEQKNTLPINIHEGITNTTVFIEDGVIHVAPTNDKHRIDGVVQWLQDQLTNKGSICVDAHSDLFELAKKMEGKVTEDTSDGYHTFKELYEFRKVYNAALFNQWAGIRTRDGKDTLEAIAYDVHKSWKHNDGELCFGGGWFIVVAILPGGQISNHYKAEDWDLFQIPEVEKAKYPFDGHTGQDVINRLINISIQ